MAVRLKEWMIPYTWWIGIEITDNHVINVLLRAMNNLIHVNEDRELYVDLQLDDGIEPDDDFPVGVTTGKILQEDWRQQSGIILNWKTTSWDYVRLIYANDWKLYYDPWTGDRIEISTWVCNTKTFYISSLSDLETAQEAYDWYLDGNNPIVVYKGRAFVVASAESYAIRFNSPRPSPYHYPSYSTAFERSFTFVLNDGNVASIGESNTPCIPNILATDVDYQTPYTPQYDWSPATKKYVDDGLALKQDILTPWTNITIDPVTNIISANINGVLIYKWNVADAASLPSTGQSVWDTYFVEWSDTMYSWDWTQWNQVWGTWIDLSNFFNKTTDTTDNITEWNINKFVTTTEKNYWNNKQDKLIAGENIFIDDATNTISSPSYTGWHWIEIVNHVVTNELPFEPENEWALAQVLKKTSTWYRWANETGLVTSVNGEIWDVLVTEFDPENAGTTGQILKKTDGGYRWSDESSAPVKSVNWETGYVTVDEFQPENSWSVGQVLKKTSTWYKWQNESSWGWGGWGWTTYYGWDYISISSSNYINNDAPFTPAEWWTTGQVLTKTADGYEWASVELPSGDNNVKFWTIESNDMDPVVEAEIMDWITEDVNNWAILNDTYTKDVYIYDHTTTVGQMQSCVFFGVNRNTEKHTDTAWYDYTVWYQNRLTIATNGTTYSTVVDENPDPLTHTNYLSVTTSSGYSPSHAFMPTEDYQPATKKYVDSVASWSSTWVITSNTTWTTSRVSQEWVWTQAEYNSLWTYEAWVIYNIIG